LPVCLSACLSVYLLAYLLSSWMHSYLSLLIVEMDRSTWEGAAFVMGNSTKQWQASYNPNHKKRAIQGAVGAHASFTSQLLALPNSSQSLPACLPPSTSLPVSGQGTSSILAALPLPTHGSIEPTFVSPRGRKRKDKGGDGSVQRWWGEWGAW